MTRQISVRVGWVGFGSGAYVARAMAPAPAASAISTMSEEAAVRRVAVKVRTGERNPPYSDPAREGIRVRSVTRETWLAEWEEGGGL